MALGKGCPDLKPIFEKAAGADSKRAAEAEEALKKVYGAETSSVKMGCLLGAICCPCTLGCSVCCCPMIFAGKGAGKMQEWSNKYPLIAIEVKKNNPVTLENGQKIDIPVADPELGAVNKRRAELGMPPTTEDELFKELNHGMNPEEACKAAEAELQKELAELKASQ